MPPGSWPGNPSMSSATMLRTAGIVGACRVSFPSPSLSSSRGCPPLAYARPPVPVWMPGFSDGADPDAGRLVAESAVQSVA